MTPGELFAYIRAVSEVRSQEARERIICAWLTASWQRVKRMPSIKKMLSPAPKKMSREEMLREIRSLNAQFGGTTY